MSADPIHYATAAPAEGIVLVPLDEEPERAAAIPIAREVARIRGGTLHLLLIAESESAARTLLERTGLSAEDLHGAVLDHSSAHTAEGVLEVASQWPGTVIVIGMHAVGEEEVDTLGAVLRRLLRRSPGPVILVPHHLHRTPWALRRILVPHDGTPTTSAAIVPAMELAEAAHAELIVLHVARPGTLAPTEPGTFTAPRYIDQPQHEWPAWAHEFVERFCARATALPGGIRLLLAAGEPGAEIVRYAESEKADLLVLGWRGRLARARAETMKHVIRSAPCPVWVERVGG
jgi:nucleotide-binding universal stress UspA family protein